jgi:pSer/pThr/pTyr-binding forkhead associated (FHA) protein
MIADVIDGPLKGEKRKVGKAGATLGRSPDNTLSIADPELSRRHSKVEFDERDGKVRGVGGPFAGLPLPLLCMASCEALGWSPR